MGSQLSQPVWGGGSVCCLVRRKVTLAETEERASSQHILLLRFIRQGEKGSEAGQRSWNHPVNTFSPSFFLKTAPNSLIMRPQCVILDGTPAFLKQKWHVVAQQRWHV